MPGLLVALQKLMSTRLFGCVFCFVVTVFVCLFVLGWCGRVGVGGELCLLECVCVWLYLFLLVYACIFICLCGWVGVVLSVCVCVYVFARVCAHVYVCMYVLASNNIVPALPSQQNLS